METTQLNTVPLVFTKCSLKGPNLDLGADELAEIEGAA
jgi:hypothetical protein